MLSSICGTWDMVSNVNFEGYMIALGKYLDHATVFFNILKYLKRLIFPFKTKLSDTVHCKIHNVTYKACEPVPWQ